MASKVIIGCLCFHGLRSSIRSSPIAITASLLDTIRSSRVPFVYTPDIIPAYSGWSSDIIPRALEVTITAACNLSTISRIWSPASCLNATGPTMTNGFCELFIESTTLSRSPQTFCGLFSSSDALNEELLDWPTSKGKSMCTGPGRSDLAIWIALSTYKSASDSPNVMDSLQYAEKASAWSIFCRDISGISTGP